MAHVGSGIEEGESGERGQRRISARGEGREWIIAPSANSTMACDIAAARVSPVVQVVVRCVPWRRRGGEIHMIIIHVQGEQAEALRA